MKNARAKRAKLLGFLVLNMQIFDFLLTFVILVAQAFCSLL